jgi:hypothetical protein
MFRSWMFYTGTFLFAYMMGRSEPVPSCVIRTGLPVCNITRTEACTKEGCFLAPIKILERGRPREHLFHAKPSPSFVVFEYYDGWFSSLVYNTSTVTTIRCIEDFSTK